MVCARWWASFSVVDVLWILVGGSSEGVDGCVDGEVARMRANGQPCCLSLR